MMRGKRFVLMVAAMISLPLVSFADLEIINKTNSFGTAKIVDGPCSADAGDSGIIKPNSTLTIAQWVFDFYCSPDCVALIKPNKSCAGDPIATLNIDRVRGVTKIQQNPNAKYKVKCPNDNCGNGSHSIIVEEVK